MDELVFECGKCGTEISLSDTSPSETIECPDCKCVYRLSVSLISDPENK